MLYNPASTSPWMQAAKQPLPAEDGLWSVGPGYEPAAVRNKPVAGGKAFLRPSARHSTLHSPAIKQLAFTYSGRVHTPGVLAGLLSQGSQTRAPTTVPGLRAATDTHHLPIPDSPHPPH